MGWPGSKSTSKIFGYFLIFSFVRYCTNEDFPTPLPPIIISFDVAVS